MEYFLIQTNGVKNSLIHFQPEKYGSKFIHVRGVRQIGEDQN